MPALCHAPRYNNPLIRLIRLGHPQLGDEAFWTVLRRFCKRPPPTKKNGPTAQNTNQTSAPITYRLRTYEGPEAWVCRGLPKCASGDVQGASSKYSNVPNFPRTLRRPTQLCNPKPDDYIISFMARP